MKQLLALLLLLPAANVFAQDKSAKPDPFKGMDQSALIRQFGQPDSSAREGKGGTTLFYIRRNASGGAFSSGGRQYAITGTREERFIYHLDAAGKVDSWEYIAPAKNNTPIAN